MVFKGEGSGNWVYGIIAVIIIIVIVLTIIFSANNLTPAYIDDDILADNNWSEDITERYYEERLFGLEKQASFTYRINDSYPSYLTVTSIKTLFMMSEDELLSKTIETINNEIENFNIVLDNTSKIEGDRLLNSSHKTMYVIYNGTDTSKNPSEKIKIIGETWNCAGSGTSIICIGLAQITDNIHNNSDENLLHWTEIIKENGLIFNVRCH